MYNELPVIKIEAIRGNAKSVLLRNIVVNGSALDFTAINPRVQFKSSIDSQRYIEFEKTIDNEGMIITIDSLQLKFGKETAKLAMGKYYGDLLVEINGNDATIVRFELELTGVVTTDNK